MLLCGKVWPQKKKFGAKEGNYNIKLKCQHADLPNVNQYIFICLPGHTNQINFFKKKLKTLPQNKV